MNDKELQDRMNAAISGVFAELDEDEPSLVSRWTLVVERVQARGSTCSYISSESLSTWEVIGMTEAASELAKAQLIYSFEYSEDDEEDEDEEV